MSTVTKDLYDIGEDAAARPRAADDARHRSIRRERFGAPKDAFQAEVVEMPEIGPREALVYVMAAGINYNNVWAALGIPVDVIKVHDADRRRRPASTSAAATPPASSTPSATRSRT